MQTTRTRIYRLLQPHSGAHAKDKWVDISLTALIVVNIVFLMLETVPSLDEAYRNFFWNFELFSVGIFTAEYIARLWTIVEDPKFAHPVWGRLRYAITPIAIFDLMAFLPFLLPFIHADLMFMRSVRLFRLLRIFKVTRYVQALRYITDVIRDRAEELLISFTFMLFMLIVFSGIIYNLEHTAQPEAFSSIPQSMWWTIITLTTVGYGDIYPITPLGKVVAALTAITGLGLFAIPTAILVSGFNEKVAKHKHHPHYCPHCGKVL
jgi:voltage-gated potassium channel